LNADVEIHTDRLGDIARLARQAEVYGFDCLWVDETKHDPFLQLTLAASSTGRISLGTSIALAFTRSPTTLAHTAWDLQSVANGRLILGLGSQVKGHIERRFGLKWESPAPKMKEVVMALRAVWKSWQNGSKLDFQGKFFKLDLMTPFFSPPPMRHPTVPIYLAGVNTRMCRTAGEVGDGLHVHPLHTVRYLREVLSPALSVGLQESGRKRRDVIVAASVFAAVGENEIEMKKKREEYRKNIAFYASTRTYRRVLELHNWGDVCERLHDMTMRGEWERLAGEISDDILAEFVVEGSWKEMGETLRKRYSGIVDRIRLYLPFDGSKDWKTFVSGFKVGN
jgi:probable F420-dependent oxidoreductase